MTDVLLPNLYWSRTNFGCSVCLMKQVIISALHFSTHKNRIIQSIMVTRTIGDYQDTQLNLPLAKIFSTSMFRTCV